MHYCDHRQSIVPFDWVATFSFLLSKSLLFWFIYHPTGLVPFHRWAVPHVLVQQVSSCRPFRETFYSMPKWPVFKSIHCRIFFVQHHTSKPEWVRKITQNNQREIWENFIPHHGTADRFNIPVHFHKIGPFQ
jgi:hypothetical protein